MYSFEELKLESIDNAEFNDSPDKTVFTTKEWIRFIAEDQNATPVILGICKNNALIGFFAGAVISKYGIKIFGSPFRGWSTCFMGLDLKAGFEDERVEIYKELKNFLIKKYRCHYIEITERNITFEQAKRITKHTKAAKTLELDINKPADIIFKQLKVDCRNFIRQFERRGARLEIAEPTDEFAEEYYNQLIDVFAKQGLVPTYSLQKVKTLIHNLKDSGHILCLRIIDPNEKCIASSIFFGMGKKFFFWGGASYRQDQMYRPNEYMIWYAINYWKEKGCTIFDMVGIREYKRKFGPVEIDYPRIILTKYEFLISLRDMAEKCYYQMIKLKGIFVKKPTASGVYIPEMDKHDENKDNKEI